LALQHSQPHDCSHILQFLLFLFFLLLDFLTALIGRVPGDPAEHLNLSISCIFVELKQGLFRDVFDLPSLLKEVLFVVSIVYFLHLSLEELYLFFKILHERSTEEVAESFGSKVIFGSEGQSRG
jgi:hypothetical protein